MKELKNMKWTLVFVLGAIILLAGAGILLMRSDKDAVVPQDHVKLHHIHGLGFTADGRLWIPAHGEMWNYKNGQWSLPDIPKHDYMGFSMVDNGFYSSGHPANDSNLPDPLGLVKSTDGGKTIQTLAFSGESDFHMMAVGEKSHTIYVANQKPNSQLKHTGVFYSTDDGMTWTQSRLQGIEGQIGAIAVHPTKSEVVVAGTSEGLYVSQDYGNHFKRQDQNIQVTSLYLDETDMYVAGKKGKQTVMFEQNLSKPEQRLEIRASPFLNEDVLFITEHPVEKNQIVIATLQKNIYQTNNQGESWDKLLENGSPK